MARKRILQHRQREFERADEKCLRDCGRGGAACLGPAMQLSICFVPNAGSGGGRRGVGDLQGLLLCLQRRK